MDGKVDYFGVDFDKASALGDAFGRLLGKRIAALALRTETRDYAAEVIAQRGTKFQDEGVLWQEWRNDHLARPTGTEAFERARCDPDRNYRHWIEERVLEPYRVSYRAFDRVAGRIGIEQANLLINVRWRQEIAWANRLRRSDSDNDAIISNMFLTKAQRDASSEFVKLADAFVEAYDDFAYVSAPEHEYEAAQVRSGFGRDTFVPLFLRRGRVAYAQNLERLPPKTLRVTADMMRRIEDGELAAIAGARAAEAARATAMPRMTSVIAAALEVGLDSDGLLDAYDRFIAALESGEVQVRGGGMPYHELLNWLRTARHAPEQFGMRVDEMIAEAEMLSIASAPMRWISALPRDYRALGADEQSLFREWVEPLMKGRRGIPRDVVADYGFHLMRTSAIGVKK